MYKNIKLRGLIVGTALALASVTANATLVVRIADDGTYGNEIFQQISPTSTNYILGTDYDAFTNNYTIGDVTGLIGLVDNVGCNAGDFGGSLSGKIALIERGNCFFSDKVNFAAAVGAIGAIIYDNIVQPVVPKSHQDPTSIPSIFTTRAIGLELRSQVPEPTTLALMGLGLAGIGYRRHRSKKVA
ncbi:MAG: PEP-CTERM sorting domain-containing protein [Gammaproteobacteria bacterium]|nr:PEP-CTERM sorting domain-containing protein [Gammaproteobacteria bacterium]